MLYTRACAHINFKSKSKNVDGITTFDEKFFGSVTHRHGKCAGANESKAKRERDIQIINKWIDETCFWKELFLIMAKLKDIYTQKPNQNWANGTFCEWVLRFNRYTTETVLILCCVCERERVKSGEVKHYFHVCYSCAVLCCSLAPMPPY